MKFLLIVPSTARGGVEEYSLKIAIEAYARGWNVHIAFPYLEKTIDLIQSFEGKGVTYHRLQIAEPGNSSILLKWTRIFLYFFRTFFLLKTSKPNIVQIVLPAPYNCMGSILACGFLKVPTLVRFGLVKSKQNFQKFRVYMYAWARSRNQKWLTISKNNQELVSQSFLISHEEILTIYNGTCLRTSAFLSEKECIIFQDEFRRQIGVSQETKLLLTVGRLVEQKGYHDLIPLIPSIMEEFPNTHFVWVGDGEKRDDLAKQLSQLNVEMNVSFLGYRSDVAQLMQACDLFLFPTHAEGGQSFALTEAMSHHLPIVSSNASGIPEVIRDGVEGLLFQVGHSSELLVKLRWALQNLESMKIMAQKAWLRVQDFSEERMLEETFEILEKLYLNKQNNFTS